MCTFAKMISCDKCITSYDLASLFRGSAVPWTDGQQKSQNTMVQDCHRCTQLSIFWGNLGELLSF